MSVRFKTSSKRFLETEHVLIVARETQVCMQKRPNASNRTDPLTGWASWSVSTPSNDRHEALYR